MLTCQRGDADEPGWRPVKRTTLLRNLIPAVIVALVLVSSFAISAGAKQSDKPDKGDKCGYGYGQTDNDENNNDNNNENNNTQNQQSSSTSASERTEKDCNEDESDENDNGGGDRGGDRDHGKGPADRDSRS
jgi:hypothetical protein